MILKTSKKLKMTYLVIEQEVIELKVSLQKMLKVQQMMIWPHQMMKKLL